MKTSATMIKLHTVPNESFSFGASVRLNIILIALEKGLDIIDIICELQREIVKDSEINPDIPTGSFLVPTYPKTEHAFVFLSMLAKKLDCDVKNFFDFDEVSLEAKVLRLLKGLRSAFWDECVYTRNLEYEKYSMYLSWDMLFVELGFDAPVTTGRILYQDLSMLVHTGELYVEKYVLSDGSLVYQVILGSIQVNTSSQFSYMIPGGDIAYDKQNSVTDYIDILIEKNKEFFEEIS